MPAGREQPRRTRGEMILIPPVANYNWDGGANDGNDANQTRMWVSMRPTRGAFSTCTEMCGNGSTTGGQTILPVPRPILRVRLRARIGSYGVVPGHRDGAHPAFG